jgi:hypothetical protein
MRTPGLTEDRFRPLFAIHDGAVKANFKIAKNAKRKSPKGPTEFLQ